MNHRLSTKKTSLILITAVFLTAANIIKGQIERPDVFVRKQDSSLNLNYHFFEFTNLGHKRLISSLLWIATILESDIDHYKKKDLNSWMYLRFNTISLLEPKFLLTYTFGGPYLSIIKDDLEGASKIYDKGLEIYPTNYQLLRNASFHYHFEVVNQKRSYEIFQKIRSLPNVNPIILGQLARIEMNHGNAEAAFEILQEQYNNIKDKESFLAHKIFENLYAIKAEIDLTCLNNHQINCQSSDLENHPYLHKDDFYFSQKNWKPFRLKTKTSK